MGCSNIQPRDERASTWYVVLTLCQGRIPDVTLGCIQYLRKQFPSIRVSVEVEKPGRPGLEELANVADVVFYSKSWAQVRIKSGWMKEPKHD